MGKEIKGIAVITGPTHSKKLHVNYHGHSKEHDYNKVLKACWTQGYIIGTVGDNVLLDNKTIISEELFLTNLKPIFANLKLE